MSTPRDPEPHDVTRRQELSAGGFSSWLRRMRGALMGEDVGTDVPCGECCACCASSHFVHVGPGETRTLAAIPAALLFPAPGLPTGTKLMGYDEHGRCPMLAADGRCSIYEVRPLTCRTYDCRVFAAAGIAADRPPITERTRRWRFAFPAQVDRDDHAAVKAAASFVRERPESFRGRAAPCEPVQVALLAIRTYEVFLAPGGSAGRGGAPPAKGRSAADLEVARAVIETDERFGTAPVAPVSGGSGSGDAGDAGA